MTDTPIPMNSPPSWVDQAKAAVGDLARPVSLLAISGATAFAIIRDFDPATIGAAGLIAGGMYGFKTLENREAGKQDAQVRTAQANAAASVEVAKAATPTV